MSAVTIFRMQGGRRANKLVYIDEHGEPQKQGNVIGGKYIAETRQVNTLEEMAELLRDIGSDPALTLSLGVFKGDPGGPFQVWPRGQIAAALGVHKDHLSTLGMHDLDGMPTVARLKDNMIFGGWLLLDRDLVVGMPEELVQQGFEAWWSAMVEICPPLAGAGRVVVPSTSGRVLFNGKPFSEKPAWHAFVQVLDPNEIARVWPQLLTAAFGLGYGFFRPKYSTDGTGRQVASQSWTIYDPSTGSPERLVYDGKPTVRGEGLTVTDPVVTVHEGGVVDLAAFVDVPAHVQEKARAQGVRIERSKRSSTGAVVIFTVAETLRLDTELETEHGMRTVLDLWLAGVGHTRCQAHERTSDSWASFYGVHADGQPFVFDAAGTKYVLHRTDRVGPKPEDFLAVIEADLEADQELTYTRIRNVARGCVRHERGMVEVETFAGRLAKMLSGAMNTPAGKLRPLIGREMKAAAKATWPIGDADVADEADRTLEAMNARFAVVAFGGTARVCEPRAYDPDFNRPAMRVLRFGDFRALFDNQTVIVPGPKGPRPMPLGLWWSNHVDRRQYLDGVVCDPSGQAGDGFLNLWQGLTCEPVENPPYSGILYDHILATVDPRDNGPDAISYFVQWLAWVIQNPGERAEVAVVLRGPRGMGKGLLARAMLRLFGAHGVYVSQPDQVTGKFNGHFATALFVFADEAIFAGDPRHRSPLKSLITEPYLMLERKGIDAVQMRNRVSLMMASNEDWVVPAGVDERRFFVVDTINQHHGQHGHFARVANAIEDPIELGKFLYHLQNMDLSDFNIRAVPNTVALEEQKAHSASREEQWLVDLLSRGHLISQITMWGDGFFATRQLYSDYIHWAQANYRQRTPTLAINVFGTFLKRFASWRRGKWEKDPDTNEDNRSPGYRFGPLDKARAKYERVVGYPVDWERSPEDAHRTYAESVVDLDNVRSRKP